MGKIALVFAAALNLALYAQVPCTIAKTGPSAHPDSLNWPVVFILSDRGEYAEQIGDSHRVMIFYSYGLDDRSEVGGDTLPVPLYNVMTDFPAQGIFRIYNHATGFIVSTVDSVRVREMGGVFAGDTFTISWNPAHPALAEPGVVSASPTLSISPNPCNAATRISVTGAAGGRVTIYDLNGCVAARLSLNHGAALWNGADKASGTYLAEYSLEKRIFRKTFLLIK